MRGETIYSNGISAQLAPNRDMSTAPVSCPICGRPRLMGEVALWAHIRMRHRPVDLVPHLGDEPTRADSLHARCEAALIRIANATTIDEATMIALTALLGDETTAKDGR